MSQDGLMDQLRKGLIETALESGLTAHLDYRAYDPVGKGSGNSRNGRSAKTAMSKDSPLRLEVPRDRNSTFLTWRHGPLTQKRVHP